MKKALIHENLVIDISDTELIVPDYLFWVDCDESICAGDFYEDGGFHKAEKEAPEESVEVLTKSILESRNWKLALSDWTQLPDTPVDKVAWATYRQALRDITDQPGFPRDVSWPKEPV